jgi:predicted CXXCH cytochrome family protein
MPRGAKTSEIIVLAAMLAAARTTAAQEAHAEVLVPDAACLTCHNKPELSHADSRHQQASVACVQCHSNVDPKAKHADALDALPLEKMCAGCHGEIVTRHSTGFHKSSTCDSCHGEVHGAFKRNDPSSCKGCHSAQTEALAKSIHGGNATKIVGCVDCHGDVHAPKPKTDVSSPVSKVLQVDMCGECHAKPSHDFMASVHGNGLLRAGLTVAPACTDCHGAHDIAAVKDPTSRLSKANVVGTCEKCHTFIGMRWRLSAHGQKWIEQSRPGAPPPVAKVSGDGVPLEAPVCTTCHEGHSTSNPMVYGNYLKMARTCVECHPNQGDTFRDTFHGQATNLGLPAATCADCHTAHGMLSAKDPRSTVNQANLSATCGRCHQPINAAFLQFDPHMNPRSESQNRIIYFAWVFMTALFIFVMGFFALHASLWLQRLIVAKLRGELPRLETGGPWVRRFPPLFVGIHVTIIVTFILLAATGLPLKFSTSGWPHWFASIFGGVVWARRIHRAAALATFGYAGVYAVYLVREIVWKKRFELLWGWKSLVPGPRDFVDLWANLKWFLYRAPPPKLDRWTYWEKFDFFCIFFGVPVIGTSGLMLWFPLLVTRLFPGWVLNIAALEHSDEGLLAVAFIFIFHFFHTHLRPGPFPMDLVIFLGRMPLARFKEERPKEYQRLTESGELESLLAPAPTDREVRRATYFGWTSLIVGVVLAAIVLAIGVEALFKF